MGNLYLKFIEESPNSIESDGSGILANTEDNSAVLINFPTKAQLCDAVRSFEKEVREEFLTLFCGEYSLIVEQFGALRLSGKKSAFRSGELYGLTLQNERNPPRFSHLTNKAVLQALVRIGVLSERSSKGQPRTRLDRGAGHLPDLVGSLSRELKVRLLEEALSGDLDDTLLVDQSADVGFRQLHAIIDGSDDPVQILERLLDATGDFFFNQRNMRLSSEPAGKGTGRCYAPAWFAQYLTRTGTWLLPFRLEAHLHGFFPTRWLPVAFRMAVPEHMWPFAERCLSAAYTEGARNTTKERIGWVFLASALASNTWQRETLGTDALVRFKERCQLHTKNVSSSSLNHLVYEAAGHFGIPLPEIDHVEPFTKGKRLAQGSHYRFRWCEKPLPTNTRLVSRILGHEIDAVPQYVRDWASDLARAIELMTCDVGTAEAVFNCWLAFVFHLGPEAPKSFREVSRLTHVNDAKGTIQPSTRCFVGFMRSKLDLVGRSNPPRAISMLAQAWYKLRDADRWEDDSSCPFDTRLDRLEKYAPKKVRTTRSAIDKTVLQIISDENRRDDFAFARGYGRRQFHFILQNCHTGEYEDVFWPAVPIAIEVVINSGARNTAGRWIDSGEGDQFLAHRSEATPTENSLPTSQRGRAEAFLQKRSVAGAKGYVSTMHFCIDKIKTEHNIPWCPPHVEDLFWRMFDLQQTYNVIRKPVPAIDSNSKKRRNTSNVTSVFPLFRMPDNAKALPFADYTFREYWYALLRHCQYIVDAALGYHYPLIDAAGRPIFDIHSLRVTLATHLSNQGATLGMVRDILGQSSKAMAAHYDAAGPKEIIDAGQKLYALREDAAQRVIARDPTMLRALAREAVRPDSVVDHVGSELLLDGVGTPSASFDAFFHGICPGGRCKEGGKRVGPGKYESVWRERACGECRFRVTGPRFLAGMRDRADLLMVEIHMSKDRESALATRQQQEGNALTKNQLQAEIRMEQTLQRNLLNEWQTEDRMIQMCRTVKLANDKTPQNAIGVLAKRSEIDPTKFEFIPTETHVLVNLQRLLKQSRTDPDLSFRLPRDTEEYRRKIIRKVMASRDVAELLYRLPDNEQPAAMDIIGDMITGLTDDPSELQIILDEEFNAKRNEIAAEVSIALSTIISKKISLSSRRPEISY